MTDAETNVVPLSPLSKPIQPVDDRVVTALEDFLARARKGEIQGIALMAMESDGAGSIVSVGSAFYGEALYQNVHAALGGLESLKLRFFRDNVE